MRHLGTILVGIAAAVAGGLTLTPTTARADSVIRMIPQADLKNLDPHWTTAAITQNHGYMIYDVLFALDGRLAPKPQMVDTWSTSADGMKWSFTLRPGMTFHDGSPVTAKDAVASVIRWAKRATDGQAMMAQAESLVATAELSFELTFKNRFGPVLQVLANPALPAFIMREKEAMTDPFEQVKEQIGSGPFVFAKDEWVPGNKTVYRKFKNYLPRAEPSNGFAGGKVVKVDRVEWIYVPDNAVAVQALLAGEVDAFEQPPYDLLPLIEKDKNITVKVLDSLGKFGHIRPNFLYPPFDNVKAREALMLLIDQKQFLAAMVGDPKYEKECYSIFICGSPLASEVGAVPFKKADLDKAKRLFKEAGYNGEKVVVMTPTDQQIIGNIAALTADMLRQAGLDVDLQAMDWSTETTRRTKKDPPSQGGWNIFTTWQSGYPMTSPITSFPLVTSCDQKNWFGWPCDEEIERLRASFIGAATLDDQKQIAEAIQKRYYTFLPFMNTGQFFAPVAWRNTLVGVPNALLFEFWNIEKQG